MNPDHFEQAKNAMADKTDEEIAEQMQREMGGGISPAQRAQAAAMGIDPAQMEQMANMMKSNPEMMKMAAAQMRNMSPEQMASMAAQRGAGAPANKTPGGAYAGATSSGSASNPAGPDFPNAQRVKIDGLKSRADLNGLEGTVMGYTKEKERYNNSVMGGKGKKELVALRKVNLSKVAGVASSTSSTAPAPAVIEEDEEDFTTDGFKKLSIKEMRGLLRSKGQGAVGDSAVEKKELVALCEEHVPIAEVNKLLRSMRTTGATNGKSSTVSSSSSSGGGGGGGMPMNMKDMNPDQLQHAANQLQNMNPEQMRSQARMMRSMPPDRVRAMNPQMAALSDAQINQAATQMEQMAENPSMMQMAAQQMKNMNPDQIEQMQKMAANMSPDQLDNMKNMQAAMGGGAGGGGGGMPDMANMDMSKAADMMKNMEPDQLKSMMKMQRQMMKDNPDMFKKMMGSNPAMAGMSEEALEKQMDMMENMDPKQLKMMMGMAQKMQGFAAPLMSAYGWINAKTGGRAMSVCVAGVAIFMCYAVDYFFF